MNLHVKAEVGDPSEWWWGGTITDINTIIYWHRQQECPLAGNSWFRDLQLRKKTDDSSSLQAAEWNKKPGNISVLMKCHESDSLYLSPAVFWSHFILLLSSLMTTWIDDILSCRRTDCHSRIYWGFLSLGPEIRLSALCWLSAVAEWLCLYLFHASLCACWLPWCTALSHCFHLKGGCVFPQKTQLLSDSALWNPAKRKWVPFNVSSLVSVCVGSGFLRCSLSCLLKKIHEIIKLRFTAAWSYFENIIPCLHLPF